MSTAGNVLGDNMIAPKKVLTAEGLRTFMKRRALIGPHEFKPEVLKKKGPNDMFFALTSKQAEATQRKMGGVLKGILLVAGLAGTDALFALTAGKASKFKTKSFFTNKEVKSIRESRLVTLKDLCARAMLN